MSVFRSNKQIYVQVIDDLSGRTLAAASSLGMEAMPKKEQAAKVGELIARRLRKLVLRLSYSTVMVTCIMGE